MLIPHATICWLLVKPTAPSFIDIDLTIKWDISPSGTCIRGSTQQYTAATIESRPRYWPFGLNSCSMISALVAALLAAHATLTGTLGETAIFNCQFGSNIRMISALVAFVGTDDTTIFNCQHRTAFIGRLSCTSLCISLSRYNRCP